MKLKWREIISTILPLLFVFAASIYNPLDPDLGWHLKYGEYFFTNFQPLRENIYSSEMPNFHWPNISWGMDLLYYIFYSMGGFLGLSLAGAAVITLTFYFLSKAFSMDYWEKAIIFPVLLFFENSVNVNSFRGQLVSTLFLSILLYLLTRYERQGGKSLYFVPILFLIWANLHGLFLLGFAILLLWAGFLTLSIYWKEKSFETLFPYLKQFIPVTLLSFGATLLHPFGMGIYRDALLHFNNPLLKLVSEYGAVEELSTQWYNLIVVAVLAGIGITAFVIKKGIPDKLSYVGVFTVLYILSLSVRRYLWMMYYLTIPFLQPIARFVKPDSKQGAFRGATFLFFVYLSFVFLLKYPFSQFMTYSWNEYCQNFLQCSSRSAEALRQYYKPGKTMTPYNLGGWMIWNYPDMKPSTDGRMHVWRDEKGYSGFEHDYKLAHNIDNINASKYDVVFALKTKPIYKRLRKLAALKKWKNVYEDKSTAIFVRL